MGLPGSFLVSSIAHIIVSLVYKKGPQIPVSLVYSIFRGKSTFSNCLVSSAALTHGPTAVLNTVYLCFAVFVLPRTDHYNERNFDSVIERKHHF